jgi:hypothetical protein
MSAANDEIEEEKKKMRWASTVLLAVRPSASCVSFFIWHLTQCQHHDDDAAAAAAGALAAAAVAGRKGYRVLYIAPYAVASRATFNNTFAWSLDWINN